MNIAVTEEENLFPSFAYSSFLRFTGLSFAHKRSASTINPRFRWDKAVLILQLKEDNNNILRDGFVTSLG